MNLRHIFRVILKKVAALKFPLRYPLIFNVHNVSKKPYLAGNWLFPWQFEAILKFLKERFEFGDPEDPLNLSEREFLITFDDGLMGIYENSYPIMERMGIKGIVFVVVDYIGKKNLWDAHFLTPVYHMGRREILELSSKGWIIGSHGKTHRSLKGLDFDGVLREVDYSKKYLEDLTGKEVVMFSYPFGICSSHAERALEEAGYKFAFCGISGKNMKIERFRIPRIPTFITDVLINLKVMEFYTFLDKAFSLPSKLTPIYQKILGKMW